MKKKNSDDELVIYGTVKVSDTGQIAIPVDLRNDLNIKRGDHLFIIRKKNSNSFSVLTMSELIDTFNDKWIEEGTIPFKN
jgi:AbrB family looped-hinge helix DNA binding protein